MRWINLQDVDDEGFSPSLPHLKGLETGDTATSRIKQARRPPACCVHCANARQCRCGV